jgi:hypothetical protein
VSYSFSNHHALVAIWRTELHTKSRTGNTPVRKVQESKSQRSDSDRAIDLAKKYAPPPAPADRSRGNALGQANASLEDFVLPVLSQYTKEGTYSNDASKDFHLFFVGRDNVHEILVYILSRVTQSLYLNMYSYDDTELNNVIMTKVLDRSVTVLITLDKSQSSNATEKALLAADQKEDLAAYNTHFVIGESATGQISHTKGFVADSKVGAEGSTNWSASGQGVGTPGTRGYKAQNNTQTVFTNPDAVASFQTELISEHMAAGHKAASPQAKAKGLLHNKAYTGKIDEIPSKASKSTD